jgi:hypothetical protein
MSQGSVYRTKAGVLIGLLCVLTASSSSPATFTVNSSGDSHDINPGDGIAADHANPDSSRVTFRTAVEEANALAGSDTILVPPSVSPVRLSLGPIVVADAQTFLQGIDSLPVIDGFANPLAVPSIVLESDSNSIRGLMIKRSRGHGILISGACNAIESNTIIDNGLDNVLYAGVAITGEAAQHNRIAGNLIGVYGNGALVAGNRIGVLIDQGASGNVVGGESEVSRNIISGNESSGVILTGGAYENRITGNFVGPDITGTLAIGAQQIGILVTNGASGNSIGSAAWPAGNLISGNTSHGVMLSGAGVDSNFVNGNVIGMSAIGRLRLANGGDGIAITQGAADNQIGDPGLAAGNFISGNDGSGVRITGCFSDNNRVMGNVIGLDVRGMRSVGNGWIDGAGVLIEDSARYNHIGGPAEHERNVISGNLGFGVHIRGGSTGSNVVSGNYVGPAPTGVSYSSNLAGVVVSDGAQSNLIGGAGPSEGNVISGNRSESFPFGAGVTITGAGSSWNRVSGNLIGLDATGARVMPNGSAGVIIGDGASDNVIGGVTESERNVITGNGTLPLIPGVSGGVHLYGVGTENNDVIGNYIGLIANGTTSIGNRGSGVGIYAGASHNHIGGDSAVSGNVITDSEIHGIVVDGYATHSNLIRYNRIYNNDGLGIVLTNSAQDGIAPPLLIDGTASEVTGSGGPGGGSVDIYLSQPDPSGYGEALDLVGSAPVETNGAFTAMVHGVVPGDTLTAIAIDSADNSSAFSWNIVAGQISVVEDDPAALPSAFTLSQNYPNPFNPETSIRYALPSAARVDLRVYNALGQLVANLVSETQPAGWYEAHWSGLTDQGQLAASGIYLYLLEAGSFRDTRKMILLK